MLHCSYRDAGRNQRILTYTRKVGQLLVDALSNDWTCPCDSEQQQEGCLKRCEHQEDQDSESCQWPASHSHRISLPEVCALALTVFSTPSEVDETSMPGLDSNETKQQSYAAALTTAISAVCGIC